MKLFSGLSLLSLVLLVFAGQASLAIPARTVSNHYSFTLTSNWDFGGHVYYSCDSVEDAAKDMLQRMGARNVQTHCTGGIDQGHTMPPMEAYLTVSYDSLKATSAGDSQAVQGEYTAVELRGFDNCFLAQQLFKKFLPTFDTKDVSPARHCANPGSNYLYRLSVLR
jgi:hypothetical protein